MLQSIYTHAGCDYGCLYTYSPRHCFNPHTHAGCDNVHNVSGASFPVSIHTPTQGVTFLYICNVFRICFNPHTHAGCDNPLPRLTRVHNRFNPHTHAGCDYCKDNKCKIISVSIHTPTQGVTSLQCFWFFHWHVSIHTPTQGVTFDTTSSPNLDFSFNPHTHAGCDGLGESVWVSQQTFQSTHPRRVWLRITLQLDECIWVSIHTPTQGVTPHSRHKSVLMRFNPHTHAGCDKEEESCTDFIGFQSTHPRRVWLDCRWTYN